MATAVKHGVANGHSTHILDVHRYAKRINGRHAWAFEAYCTCGFSRTELTSRASAETALDLHADELTT